MKYIDLFSGVGGFRYGIDKAWKHLQIGRSGGNNLSLNGSKPDNSFRKKRRDSKHANCVYSNEFNKYANSVYRRHYGECDSRDIREVKEIPDFDLLCAGFPCQSFSIAGKRGGFNDTRGTLFFEIARIVKQKQPRLLLLENVKGLLSHDKGNTFVTIISTLDELGYDCQWQVLNSKNFGVPQNRERVFIIGHLRGTGRPQVFPLGLRNESHEIKRLGHMEGFRRYNQTYDESGVVEAIDTAGGGGHQPCIVSNPHGFNKGGNRKYPNVRKSAIQNEFINGIRRLTPIECERLQGFPDNWTQYGVDGEKISDTQRYKMMGNAVTTNVIIEIVKKLILDTR